MTTSLSLAYNNNSSISNNNNKQQQQQQQQANQSSYLVPEIFRFSAKVQLAETLSYLSPVPIESIEILIKSCCSLLPNQQFIDVQSNNPSIKKIFDSNPTLFSTMISIRAQESVIALSHFYKCSNGNADKRIIPILKSFLIYLTYMGSGSSGNSSGSNQLNQSSQSNGSVQQQAIFSQSNGLSLPVGIHQNDIQNSQNFTYYLLNQLAILSHLSIETSDEIISTFIEFFSQIIKNEQVPIIYGTLQALADKHNSFNFNNDQLSKVIQLIELIVINETNIKFNQKKILLLVCNAFEQITHLDHLEKDVIRIYKNVFPYTSSSIAANDNEAFISIINTITRCGALDQNIGKEVLDYSIRFISEIKNLTDDECMVLLDKAYCEQLYQSILTSLVEMTNKYSEKLLKVIDVLKDFLCVSTVVRNSEETRNSLFNCICTILINEYKKERGVDVCKSIITSLLNTLHTLYINYSNSNSNNNTNITTAAAKTTVNNNNARYSIKSPVLNSQNITTTATQASPLSIIQQQSLKNIIIIIGKITCSLNDLGIIEITKSNFISILTFPPTEIDNLILFQLTDIGLLEHPAITDSIVAMITNLFKKICKDSNQGLITNITDICLQKLAKHLVNEKLRQDLCRKVLKLFQQLGKSFRRGDTASNNTSDPNYYLSSPILKGMGFLLPTIAELIKAIPIKILSDNNNIFIQPQLQQQQQQQSSTTTTTNNNNNSNEEENDHSSDIKLYRSVWFYCVFFKFTNQGIWRSDWWNSTQIIAAHLSPLVSNKPHVYLEIEVELDNMIKQGLEKDYFYYVKQSLIELLPTYTAYIKNLSLPQLAFIHCVYMLETMRFTVSGSFEVAFTYLEDQGIENINVSTCIRAIVDKVFGDFLTSYSSMPSSAMVEQELVNHTVFLLFKFCYPYEPVRKAADEYIPTLASKFPQVLWNKFCLSTLLDLIEAAGKGAKAKPMDMISVRLTHSQLLIELPDETPVRQRLLQEAITLGNIWLKSGTNAAPSEIQELLQEYMQKFNQLQHEHIGLSLAVEIGSKADIDADKLITSSGAEILNQPATATGGTLFSGFNNQHNQVPQPNKNTANFVNSLQLKALYGGEIKGMLHMMNVLDGQRNATGIDDDDDEEEISEEIEDRAYDILVKEFEFLITNVHKSNVPANSVAFISIMYRSCAFLINHYFGSNVRLIHMICYAPAYIFTRESMDIGIGCWKWLIVERPDLTKFIMTSISDIWGWTVNQKIGLFANNERDPSPLAISAQQPASSANVDSGITSPETTPIDQSHPIHINDGGFNKEEERNKYIRQFRPPKSIDKTSDVPHKLWLDFLEERYSVARYGSQEQMDIIIGIVQKSIIDHDGLSVSPKSLGTRFKLLLLAIKLIQGDHIRDAFNARLMRERVYLSALSWFYLPPIWYGQAEAGSQTQLEIDTKTLIEFCKSLQVETIFQSLEINKRYTIMQGSNNSGITTSNGSSVGSVGSANVNSVRVGGGGSSLNLAGGSSNSVGNNTANNTGNNIGYGSVSSGSGIGAYATIRGSKFLSQQPIDSSSGSISSANGLTTPYGSNGIPSNLSSSSLANGFSMNNYGSGIGVGISPNTFANHNHYGGGGNQYSSSSVRSNTLKQINESSSVSSFDVFGSVNDNRNPMLDIAGGGVGTMTSLVGQQISQALLLDSINGSNINKPVVSDAHLIELRKRRNLILLLVGNELERMSAWNSPVNRISTQIPEQTKFVYENLPKSMKSKWKDYLIAAWKINPKLAIHFYSRFPLSKIRNLLSEMVVKNTKAVLDIPEALPFLVTEENVKANIPELKYLLYWETVTPPMAISLLGKSYHSHPLVSQYACRVLRSFPPETIMFYIPQLVQSLRYDRSGQVESYLVQASKTSELLAHQIIWNVQTYTESDPNGRMTIIDDPVIQSVTRRLKDRVIEEMQTQDKVYNNYREEFEFFESFTSISGRLLQLKDPSKRKGQLRDELKMLSVANNHSPLYMPTNPKSLVVGLEVDSAMTLQSAAKVPILVNFKVVERSLPTPSSNIANVKSPPPSSSPPIETTSSVAPTGTSTSSIQSSSSSSTIASLLPLSNAAAAAATNNNNKNVSPLKSSSSSSMIIPPPLGSTNPMMRESTRALRKHANKKVIDKESELNNNNKVKIQGCIFKSGDDIRQDMLALQIIDIFKRIFKHVGLDLYLFPYKVIATKPGCGMIELVPGTMSRDQIGKKVNGSLYNYFISKYGNINSVGFQNARRNFIKSMAAYSVVSYILQIKDRHNANILVDEEGHIVHIDFGFIFDISPGGELLTFEASPFKMNQEMIDIMGGKPNSEQFVWFMEQSVRAFLAARQHMDSIITLVELMLDTKLPCFREQTIHNLRQRFCPNKSESIAAKFMTKIVLDSLSTISTFSTMIYDLFQYVDNGIEM